MKDTLRTRLEFLWAKLAGRDVDIDTLTPDAPTNMVEKLMIETADRIADAEQGGGGGGNVVIVDLGELPVEHEVNATNPFAGEVELFQYVYLFDVDQNKYYIFKTTEGFVGEGFGLFDNIYYSPITSSTYPFSACEDTSDEEWIEGKTFSDTVDVTTFATFNSNGDLFFVPTSTQFKTYKKVPGSDPK